MTYPNNLLQTDGYKFSMAEAGFPLRQETFYYSHRKGGWQFLPIDVEAFIRANLPFPQVAAEHIDYLNKNNYQLGGASREAFSLRDQIKINALPKGSWFYEREPVFTVTGPSALVSWLEPLVLQLNFRIQIATAALLLGWTGSAEATCESEADIIRETLESVRRSGSRGEIRVNPEGYRWSVFNRASELVRIVEDPDRLFEVGMRAVTCEFQHRIALEAIREAGIKRTSNVALARILDMVPVGTMGHEHIQRHGSDYAAFTAMRDRQPGFVFYLPDTFDTMRSGVPAALRAMLDNPTRNSGIRFDSEHGILGHYLYAVNRAREIGLTPVLGLESGWDDKKTTQFEQLRKIVDWPADRQAYGYGGYLVSSSTPFTRDQVAAVWKISQTGDRATMKFGDEPQGGKSSIPGRPVVWRPHLGMAEFQGPVGYIAQENEDWQPPVPATLLSGVGEPVPSVIRFRPEELLQWSGGTSRRGLAYSPATQALIARCTRERAANIALFESGD